MSIIDDLRQLVSDSARMIHKVGKLESQIEGSDKKLNEYIQANEKVLDKRSNKIENLYERIVALEAKNQTLGDRIETIMREALIQSLRNMTDESAAKTARGLKESTTNIELNEKNKQLEKDHNP